MPDNHDKSWDVTCWESLLNAQFTDENAPKTGDIPNYLTPLAGGMGTDKPSNHAGCSDKSPESPKSPLKKEGTGTREINTPAPSFGVQIICATKQETLATENKGFECGQCNYLIMVRMAQPNTRRLFHWRCSQGFNILEASYAGERILIAPTDCDKHSTPPW